jgi:hypothetical protein
MLSSSQQTLQASKAWQNHVWLLQPRFVPTISGWKLYIKMFVQQYKTSKLGTSCLEIVGLYPIFFIRLFGFRGGVAKLYWILPLYGIISHSMVSQLAENVMEVKI